MKKRAAAYPIADLILNRCSPRAFSDDMVTKLELMSLFEAARWAPSAYNSQPWRFVYTFRGTPFWQRMFDLLVDFNKAWAQRASVLVLICSRKTFELNNKPSRTHSFDTGAAWQNLALQAWSMGIIAHGMEGFSYSRAQKEIQIPDDYQVEAMVAVRKPGPLSTLSPELQKREELSDRKSVDTFVFEGSFGNAIHHTERPESSQ